MKKLLSTILCLFVPVILLAQGFNSRNGRNHPELKWQVAETEHFKIMYPQRIAGIEAEAAAIAEESYKALSSNLNTTFEDKIRIYLSDEDEISNGFAVPIGNGYTDIWVNLNDYADIWTGEVKWLRKVLAHELAHIFHFKAVEGTIGFWQFVIGDPLPGFWTEGLAQYETEKWDSQRGDRWLRRAVFDDQMNYNDGQSIINGRLRYALGNSQLRYFAETYGDSTLAELLHHRKKIVGLKYHDFYDAFDEATGQSYQSFYDEWRKHVNVYYNTLASQMDRTDSLGVDPTPYPGNFIYDVAFSPDQSQYATLALTSMKRPVKRLYLTQNDSTRNTEILAEGGINDDVSWSPDGRYLTYSRSVRGEHSSILNDLFIYDLETEKEERITHSRRARYPVFSEDESRLSYVVNEGSTANIYQRDLESGQEAKVTNYGKDVQLLHLTWNHPRNELIYHRFDAEGNRNLVTLNVDSGEEQVLDDNILDNRMPVVSPDGSQLAFTSLRDEVPNVFIYDYESRTAKRFTHQITGAEAYDWLPATDSTDYGQLVLTASESKNQDYLFLVPDTVDVSYADTATAPKPYAEWRKKLPPNIIPWQIDADESLIKNRSSYNSFSNITHAFSFTLPYYDGENDFGIFGMTSWTEPLGKHTIAGGGNISFNNFDRDSYGVLTYVNNQLYPTIAFSGYKIPGTGQFYGSDFLIEELTGGEIKATWPIDWFSESYRSDRFSARLRHVLVRPDEQIDVFGSSPNNSVPNPVKARQTDLQLVWTTKKQRPYYNNLLHPIDGYGVRVALTGSEKILGSETAFFTPDISAYKILPGIGLHRFYLYGRFQAQFGTPLPQDYIGFSRYSNIDWPIPEGDLSIPYTKPERVRGYKSFVSGRQVAFGTLEYRIPFLPSLGTSILGFLELNRTSIALFTDAGVVWDVQIPSGSAAEKRWGLGAELKNEIQLGPISFIHSLGFGQPYDDLFTERNQDLYYQIKASVPF